MDEMMETVSVGFEKTVQLLIRLFAFVRFRRQWEYNQSVQQLFINFKKAFDSVGREVVYKLS
jgi:hypothetical protein